MAYRGRRPAPRRAVQKYKGAPKKSSGNANRGRTYTPPTPAKSYSGNANRGRTSRPPVQEERQEAVRNYRASRTKPLPDERQEAVETYRQNASENWNRNNPSLLRGLRGYRPNVNPYTYAPDPLFQRMPPGQGGMPTMNDIWAMYGTAKASEYYPFLTPRIFDAKQQYDDYYSRMINQTASMYQPAKPGAATTTPTIKKGYHGLGNVRRIRQAIYNKPENNEAQGTTPAPETGGGETGGGYEDWGYPGGGGGGSYTTPGYGGSPFTEYRQGYAAQGTQAQPGVRFRGYGQQPNYGNGYATQNGAQRWLQLLTNWRI